MSENVGSYFYLRNFHFTNHNLHLTYHLHSVITRSRTIQLDLLYHLYHSITTWYAFKLRSYFAIIASRHCLRFHYQLPMKLPILVKSYCFTKDQWHLGSAVIVFHLFSGLAFTCKESCAAKSRHSLLKDQLVSNSIIITYLCCYFGYFYAGSYIKKMNVSFHVFVAEFIIFESFQQFACPKHFQMDVWSFSLTTRPFSESTPDHKLCTFAILWTGDCAENYYYFS